MTVTVRGAKGKTCLKYATNDRDFLEAYINYGYWNFQYGNYNKTIDLYKHALDLEPAYDSAIILCMGYVYRLAGDPDQSMKSYILLNNFIVAEIHCVSFFLLYGMYDRIIIIFTVQDFPLFFVK